MNSPPAFLFFSHFFALYGNTALTLQKNQLSVKHPRQDGGEAKPSRDCIKIQPCAHSLHDGARRMHKLQIGRLWSKYVKFLSSKRRTLKIKFALNVLVFCRKSEKNRSIQGEEPRIERKSKTQTNVSLADGLETRFNLILHYTTVPRGLQAPI
jgi:hypothetical protein